MPRGNVTRKRHPVVRTFVASFIAADDGAVAGVHIHLAEPETAFGTARHSARDMDSGL